MNRKRGDAGGVQTRLGAAAWILTIVSGDAASAAGLTNFVSFDVPGAAWTRAWDVNDAGVVVGIYKDSVGVRHGFRRSAGGTITTVDYPGASLTSLLGLNDNVNADGLPDQVGRYESGGVDHGFLLSNGQFYSIDPPGSVDTQCHGINAAGQIVGRFWDYKNDGIGGGYGHRQEHGFILNGGAYQTIDYPDSATTDAWKITDSGSVIGDWSSLSAVKAGGTINNLRVHGYTLTGDSYASDDVPGAENTSDRDGNSSRQIVGTYSDKRNVEHGFVWNRGTYTLFDYPGAAWTNANGVNDLGVITGSYSDAGGAEHAFIAQIDSD